LPLPWLRILDAVIGITDLARGRRMGALGKTSGGVDQQLEAARRGNALPLSGLEARLAGVMVAALKEVFERDNRRLEFEQAQVEAERERAERALKLELLRQRADREIGRMRLLAAVGVVGWLGTLSYAPRMVESAARVMFGGGWLSLLAAVAVAFGAQARIAAAVDRAKGDDFGRESDWSNAPGLVTLCLVVVGLALLGFAILL
jgi:hypothetical protein